LKTLKCRRIEGRLETVTVKIQVLVSLIDYKTIFIKARNIMNDTEIEKIILGKLKKRGIIWLDMVGGQCLSYEENHQRICRDNIFMSTSWLVRMIELLSDGRFNPNAKQHTIIIPFQDLFRFWWNNCICQEDIVDEIFEDIYVYFKDKMRPLEKEKPEEPIHYDLEFSEIIQHM